MDNDLFWLFTLNVKPGKFDEFKRLVSDVVAATRKEPGTLAYQYAANEDQTIVHIYERYRDSEAFVTHVEQAFAEYAERFLSLVSVESLIVYGVPNAQARKALDTFNATYMTLFDGFSRA
ncbi:Antibiotic biosynthesis monooxygenase [Collimonas sp. OK607]|uniref:putative quinol monooxygenase n=1 Tax=Collimonas sp. OK607 TaxID=1798194 RepID=UPI0008EB6253|nr:antibiotic biosynthesis monooxygenase [Collimonas sp. OK607]SFB21123.1 Antibiotic biosynthesis monooxygenase [Collimonas sp. OK607]